MIAVQIAQALAAGLQLAISLFAGAVGFPASTIAAAINADEIDFGIAFAGAAPQQGARVTGGDLAVGIRDLGIPAGVVQPRHRAKQGQAQGVEQGAFTGAGGAGNCKQPGTGQWLGGEVQLKRACQ